MSQVRRQRCDPGVGNPLAVDGLLRTEEALFCALTESGDC